MTASDLNEDHGSSADADTHREADTPIVSGHTPGPWCVAGTDPNLQPVVSTVKGDLELVTCWHHCIGSMEAQAHANARLIAAAPDLLEALRKLTDNAVAARGCGLNDDADGIVSSALFDAIMQARAALSRATGEA
jgi:hypothetical protein